MVLAHRNVDHRALESTNLVVGSLETFDPDWLDSFRPDVVLHMARLPGRGRIGRSLAARRGRRANVRLLAHLVQRLPNVHLVYVSGTLMYGDRGEDDCDESTPLRPGSFAREYARAEEPWVRGQNSADLGITIVRPPWVIGPGSWFRNFYLRPAALRGAVPVYGPGSNWMSLLDVEDCAGAILHLAEGAPGRVFNLFAPGQHVRQRDFSDEVARVLGCPVDPDQRAGGDAAVQAALTGSFRAQTGHGQIADGYRFAHTDWREMVRRNIELESPA